MNTRETRKWFCAVVADAIPEAKRDPQPPPIHNTNPPLEPIEPDLDFLSDILLAHGVQPPAGLVADLDRWCDEVAYKRTAASWRFLILSIGNRRVRAVLQLAILKTGKSLRQASREAGMPTRVCPPGLRG